MKNLVNSILALGGVLTVVTAIFFLGFAVGRHTMPTPTVTHDTVYVVDPNYYHLLDSVVNYHEAIEMALEGQISQFKPLSPIVDTIYLPTPESVSNALVSQDTLALLTKYFSVLEYEWAKQDSDLNVVLHTVITQNEPIKYDLRYNILRPSSIITNTIDNTKTYARYIQVGASLPSNMLTPFDTDFNRWRTVRTDLQYVFKRGYIGLEYYPALNIIGVKGGITLLKF